MTEPTGEKNGTAESPLKVKEPKVTRFNRRVVYAVAVVAFLVLAFSLLTIFSAKKSVQGEERPAATEKNQPPDLPDPIVSSPADYQELHRAAASSSAPAADRGMSVNRTEPERGAVETAVPATAADEQAKAKEQAERDAASAMASQVGFEMTDTTDARSEQPVKPEFLVPGTVPPQSGSAGIRGPEGMTGADDQNMQDEKRTFATQQEAEFPYLKAKLQSPISPFELKAGSILPAVLITGINSDLPGQVIAQIRESVFDTVSGNHLLIPQGTRLIGLYDSKVAFGQERVLVVWTRLILPNGNSLNLEGMPGVDLSGYAGVSGKVNNHYGKLIAGVVLGSIIGAGAQVATGGQGAPNVPSSFEQLAVSGAAQNINQAGQQITQKNLNRQPTIEVSPGDKINVFVTKDMILKPYKE